MTHLYSSCRSACLSATWRFRDALLHSTLPQSWQVNNFFADWVFREFKFSPVIEVSTETQQRTAHAAAHPQHTVLKPIHTPRVRESRIRAAFAPSPPPLSPLPPRSQRDFNCLSSQPAIATRKSIGRATYFCPSRGFDIYLNLLSQGSLVKRKKRFFIN